jgi:hypothetical protein
MALDWRPFSVHVDLENSIQGGGSFKAFSSRDGFLSIFSAAG